MSNKIIILTEGKDMDNDDIYEVSKTTIDDVINNKRIPVGCFKNSSYQINRPIIGIIEWPYLNNKGQLIYEIDKALVNKIINHRGYPLGIFPSQTIDYHNTKNSNIPNLTFEEELKIKTAIDMCDAIIKPGALKIYKHERFMYEYVVDRHMPYFGICAGMQLMVNYKRKKYIEPLNCPSNKMNHFLLNNETHPTNIPEDTVLYDILGEKIIFVNSRHKLYMPSPGNLSIASIVAFDGVIEAVENSKECFNIGVQWHPEYMEDKSSAKLFDAFIDSAKKYRRNK